MCSPKKEFCCSVTQLCPTLCDPMDCSTPGVPVLRCFPEFAQTHVHQVGDAIQPSHPLLTPSPPAFSLPQNQCLFQGIGSSNQGAKVLELQHQSFQSVFRASLVAQTTKKSIGRVLHNCKTTVHRIWYSVSF